MAVVHHPQDRRELRLRDSGKSPQAPAFVRRRLDHDKHDMAPGHPEGEPLRQHVVLCGYGRVGSSLGRALEAFSLPYVVIDRDPDIIRRVQSRGTVCLYGDASHRELLMKAGAADASLIIVALPEIEPAVLTMRRIRDINPKIPVLARAHGLVEVKAQVNGITIVDDFAHHPTAIAQNTAISRDFIGRSPYEVVATA